MFDGMQHNYKVIGKTHRASILFFHTQWLGISVVHKQNIYETEVICWSESWNMAKGMYNPSHLGIEEIKGLKMLTENWKQQSAWYSNAGRCRR
jgi:hypothetical protein